MDPFNRLQQHILLCPTCNSGNIKNCNAGYLMSIGQGSQVNSGVGMTPNEDDD